jgi:hypothetical protein
MIYLIPALMSFILGLVIIKVALKDRLPGLLLSIFLSATIGIGASGLLTFTSFFLFNQLIPWFVILLNLSITTALGFFLHRKGQLFGDTHLIQKELSVCHRNYCHRNYTPLIVLTIITIGMFTFASLYPYGGWDAWAIWNVKARFLFLGGTDWTGMLDPILWRHQILYPFLLPLINVWFWSFGNTATYAVPMAMTCLIPLLTAGILFSALRQFTGKSYVLLVPLWIFTNMFTIQLAASQYTDLLLGLFLLTAVTLFLLFQRTKEPGYLILMGLVLGMLGFTKVEGETLSCVTLITALVFILTEQTTKDARKRAALFLISATTIAAVPLIIFLLRYAPHNSGIFINGLTSPDKPTSLERLITIITYYGHEFISIKWTGLWIALTAILVLSYKKCLSRELRIIPIVLSIYFFIFTSMYLINTFYEITWWLNTSLNRIIFALVPVTALWVFLSFDETPSS